MKQKVFFLAVLAALVWLVLAPGAGWTAERGAMAPSFELPNLAGGRLKLSDFKGKVVMVNFWATWCPPCREEMPSMEKAYQEYKERGFVVLAVNVDRTRGAPVEEFIRELKLTFPVLLDPGEATKKSFGVRGLPQTVLIDRGGRVARHVYGSLDWFGGPARRVIEQLLDVKGKKVSSSAVRYGG